MFESSFPRHSLLLGLLIGFEAILATQSEKSLLGADFFVTIAGGYARQGNQASMEANVLFFQELVAKSGTSNAQHLIYFADGNGAEADVQVSENPEHADPTTRLLADLLGWDTPLLSYRNHQIEGVAGRNHPRDIRRGLEELFRKLQTGDRLFIYVTAHGGAATDRNNSHDTSIHCWDGRQIRASEFSSWLDQVPQDVPVVMVMAQCYCGGFSHAIYSESDARNGFAAGNRCGFYAQQHDLPAAGCRPDITNDQEYSSYFWGALMGHSRNGLPVENADQNNDGRISLIEAHTYAVIFGETIDIPLRSSETLLRNASQIGDPEETPDLLNLELPLADIAARGNELDASIVRQLAEQLGLELSTTAADACDLASGPLRPMMRRGRGGGRGLRMRTQQLREELIARWPTLASVKSIEDWSTAGVSSEVLWNEIQSWETYAEYKDAFDARQESRANSAAAELKQVKRRRLAQALESIVLAANLAKVADSETQLKYQAMLDLENTTF